MIDLLRPSRSADSRAGDGTGRPLALGALAAGLGAPLLGLVLTWVVGLAGWYAADGGTHGTPRDVLRIGTDAWLLAHGSTMTTGDARITAVPLGLTLLVAYVAFRAARAAAASSDADDLATVGLGTVVLAGTYGIVALAAAIMATAPGAQPSLAHAFVGGTVIGAIAGGAGLLVGSRLATTMWWSRGEDVRAVLLGAVGTVLLLVVLSALAVATSLIWNASAAANVLTGLRPDAADGVMSVLLLAAIAPNLLLLGCSYLLGPGFAMGVGTTVAPAEVVLGPVPAVPVLAALPAEGAGSGWATALLAVPVIVAAVAAVLTFRLHPTRSWTSATLRAVLAAVLAAVTLATLVRTAGGSIGPGRMTQIGAPTLELLAVATPTFATGAVLGAIAATWRHRRRVSADDEADRAAGEEPTALLDLGSERTVRIPRGPARLP